MEETMNPQLRSMIRGYEQQLLSARRLARLRVKMRLAEGESPHDPDPEIKRRAYVEKVARELYESLIYTGSDNPMVEEIRRELGKSLGPVWRHCGDFVDRRLHRSHAADDVTGGYGHEKNNNSFADGAFTGAESVCARRGVGGVRFDLR